MRRLTWHIDVNSFGSALAVFALAVVFATLAPVHVRAATPGWTNSDQSIARCWNGTTPAIALADQRDDEQAAFFLRPGTPAPLRSAAVSLEAGRAQISHLGPALLSPAPRNERAPPFSLQD